MSSCITSSIAILNTVPREEKMELFKPVPSDDCGAETVRASRSISRSTVSVKKASQNQHGGERHRSSRPPSQREGESAVQTWSEIGSSLQTAGRGFTPQDLAALVARCNRVSNLPRSEVERLGPRRSLLKLCLGLGRQPPLFYKGLATVSCC